MIAIFILTFTVTVFMFRKKLSRQTHRIIKTILAIILIFSELTYQIWSLNVGIWDAKYFLPIQLCSFSTFFGLFLLFRKQKQVFYFFCGSVLDFAFAFVVL